MCLLIDHPETTIFTFSDIEGFYKYNQDGLGVMFIDPRTGAVTVEKVLPRSAQDAYQFYLDHVAGRHCALHFRMQTHGLIDMENCHPYHIPGTDTWFMHNGVLATGNQKDVTKSDTWHYARDFLGPLLLATPDLIFTPAFQKLVGAHIGTGNRFIIMSPRGSVIINEHHGVTHKGAWLSNTYAWSAPHSSHTGPATYEGDEFFLGVYSADDDTVDYFFSVLENCALWDAYQTIRLSDIENAVALVGMDQFLVFCDYIMDAPLGDAAVRDYIRNPKTMPVFEIHPMMDDDTHGGQNYYA